MKIGTIKLENKNVQMREFSHKWECQFDLLLETEWKFICHFFLNIFMHKSYKQRDINVDSFFLTKLKQSNLRIPNLSSNLNCLIFSIQSISFQHTLSCYIRFWVSNLGFKSKTYVNVCKHFYYNIAYAIT